MSNDMYLVTWKHMLNNKHRLMAHIGDEWQHVLLQTQSSSMSYGMCHVTKTQQSSYLQLQKLEMDVYIVRPYYDCK